MPLFDLSHIEDIAALTEAKVVRLSPLSLTTLLCAIDVAMTARWQWVFDDVSLTDAQWDTADAIVGTIAEELMVSPLIGTIFPFATASPPDGALECDGATYLRSDYPDLYAILDAAFIVDALHFRVPDLRGRTIVGAGTGSGLSSYSPNDSGGEESHVLIVAETPSHSHGVTDLGHTHAEGNAAPVLLTIGAGAPTPSAIPSVGITGSSPTGITIQNTGGDGSHENRQPYTALRYAIWTT